MTFHDAQKLLGWRGASTALGSRGDIKTVQATIPPSFDAREQWPGCIGQIRDQEGCGSCWAFAATESLADRFCIASGGKVNVTLSPQWLIDCFSNEWGCNGGFLDITWKDLLTIGVTTEDCVPYQGSNFPCPSTCQGGSQPTIYKPKDAYSVYEAESSANVVAIQQEIMTNGPVEVAFWVFSDFMTYSSGVYSLTHGSKFVGGHAVKIIGWGTLNGTDYWIAANSWGPKWGANGHFMIRRGTDECSIEDEVSTGIPELNM